MYGGPINTKECLNFTIGHVKITFINVRKLTQQVSFTKDIKIIAQKWLLFNSIFSPDKYLLSEHSETTGI